MPWSFTLPHVLLALSFLLLVLGAALLWRAGRLTHPRNLLDRPSGAWLTAKEQQQRRSTQSRLRVLGTAVLLTAVGLLLVGLLKR